jgi:type III pantothenate kinase
MNRSENVLLIDVGNTLVKIGLYSEGMLHKVSRSSDEMTEIYKKLYRELGDIPMVISSVRKQNIPSPFTLTFTVSNESQLPYMVRYDPPHQLGMDRICNIAGALAEVGEGPLLVIDIGTCITYDFMDAHLTYHGGSISPGISLRYRSMHDYTDKLPLVDNREPPTLYGHQTSTCMHTGTMLGIQCELDGMIQKYRDRYPDLTIFVTGGDASRFDLAEKNDIFADENLTLKGLYSIYLLNA